MLLEAGKIEKKQMKMGFKGGLKQQHRMLEKELSSNKIEWRNF